MSCQHTATPVYQDRYGRPVAPVIGRTGLLLGYRRNDLPDQGTPAMGCTPEEAYPREPMARPLTDQERAELAARPLTELGYACGCGATVPLTGRATADGAALAIHERVHQERAGRHVAEDALSAIAAVLWPWVDDGSEDDWSMDTLDAIAGILDRAGIGTLVLAPRCHDCGRTDRHAQGCPRAQ